MALEYPSHLRYVDTHEYIHVEDDIAVIGITAYAVDQLGDIVFVGLPEEGTEIEKGESFGSVESVKAVEDLYAPCREKWWPSIRQWWIARRALPTIPMAMAG